MIQFSQMMFNKTLLFIANVFTFCFAAHAGFLTAQKFPGTTNDVSLTDRIAVETEGYEPYSGLSAYRYFELVESDANLQQEIEEIDNTPQVNYSATDANVPISNNQLNTGQTSNSATGYCANKSPYILPGQTIPLGNPTNVDGICSKYGWRDMGGGKMDPHYGVDIGCNKKHFGSPIYATADGVVEKVVPATACKSAGNYVKIRHSSGFVSMYMHLDTVLVTPGQQVTAGCQIATMGYTGGAKIQKCPKMDIDITHLHYQIAYTGNGTSVIAPNGQTIKLTSLNKDGTPTSFKTSVNPTDFVQYKN